MLEIANGLLLRLIVSVVVMLSGATGAMAQQETGGPGSPSATTTIDGKQLPAPPAKFGGKIGRTAQESTPYWPPRIVPPKGAPNVLLIITTTLASVCPVPSGASSRPRRSTGLPPTGCATRTSTRQRCARRPGPR